MIKELRVLEFLTLAGMGALVVFGLDYVSSPGSVSIVGVVCQFLMVIGALAGLGLLIVNRVTVRQDLILEQLAELREALPQAVVDNTAGHQPQQTPVGDLD